MKKQTKNRCEQLKKHNKTNIRQDGITLIALVISIIVMLILAGVSINAIVGENGVLTKAQKATIENKKASILEALNMKLAEYNINTLTDKDTETKQMLSELVGENYIEGVLCSDGTYKTDSAEVLPVPRFDDRNNFTGEFAYGVTKEDFKINIYTANDGIYKAEYGEISFSSGGGVQEGTVLVTKDSFNSSEDVTDEEKGKFTVDGNSDIIFIDKIEGELSFYIKSGAHAKVNIFNDMTLTNSGMARSAIDIEPNGILDLYVADGVTLTVDSGFGKDGEVGSENGAKGGPGGYAGIHVPKFTTTADVIIGYDDITGEEIVRHYEEGTAELNLLGSGTIISYGGNAGNGTDSSATYGGGGGGGAGAGIGGNGGKGGNANKTQSSGYGHNLEFNETGTIVDGSNPEYNTNSGWDGLDGEDCGIVKIQDEIKVYAYGGAGGSAGNGISSSGGGGGGYPAAGIGGGGAGGGGGSHAGAGGGYTGGAPQGVRESAKNGLGCTQSNDGSGGGSGYFTTGIGNIYTIAPNQEIIGGYGGLCYLANSWYKDLSGNGGKAGAGGTIKYSNMSNIFAYNGNMVTDKTEESQEFFEYILTPNVDEKTSRTTVSTTKKLSVFERKDGKKIIPLEIFAQSGVVRETYTTNQSQFTLAKVTRILDVGEVLPEVANSAATVEVVRATDMNINNTTTGYNNGYMLNQGIGSGAGYLEASNGEFKPIE